MPLSSAHALASLVLVLALFAPAVYAMPVTSVSFTIASADRIAGNMAVSVTLSFVPATVIPVAGTITIFYSVGFFDSSATNVDLSQPVPSGPIAPSSAPSSPSAPPSPFMTGPEYSAQALPDVNGTYAYNHASAISGVYTISITNQATAAAIFKSPFSLEILPGVASPLMSSLSPTTSIKKKTVAGNPMSFGVVSRDQFGSLSSCGADFRVSSQVSGQSASSSQSTCSKGVFKSTISPTIAGTFINDASIRAVMRGLHESTATIESAYLPVGCSYSFMVRVTNFLDVSTDAVVTIQKDTLKLPTVVIEGGAFRSIYSSSVLHLKANVKPCSCASSAAGFTCEWKWLSVSPAGSLPLLDKETVFSTQLYIKKNTLIPVRTYVLGFFATPLWSSVPIGSSQVTLTAKAAPLLAIINDGHRVISIMNDVVLDGSRTVDFDHFSSSNLSYSWSCSVGDGSDIPCFPSATTLFENDISILRVPFSYLSPGSYVFHLTVSNDSLSDSVSATITGARGAPTRVGISPITEIKLNSGDKISLKSLSFEPSGAVVSFEWFQIFVEHVPYVSPSNRSRDAAKGACSQEQESAMVSVMSSLSASASAAGNGISSLRAKSMVGALGSMVCGDSGSSQGSKVSESVGSLADALTSNRVAGEDSSQNNSASLALQAQKSSASDLNSKNTVIGCSSPGAAVFTNLPGMLNVVDGASGSTVTAAYATSPFSSSRTIGSGVSSLAFSDGDGGAAPVDNLAASIVLKMPLSASPAGNISSRHLRVASGDRPVETCRYFTRHKLPTPDMYGEGCIAVEFEAGQLVCHCFHLTEFGSANDHVVPQMNTPDPVGNAKLFTQINPSNALALFFVSRLFFTYCVSMWLGWRADRRETDAKLNPTQTTSAQAGAASEVKFGRRLAALGL